LGELATTTTVGDSPMPSLMYSMKYFAAPEQLHDTVADTDVVDTEIVGVEGA
jgi:hypothetical protein